LTLTFYVVEHRNWKWKKVMIPVPETRRGSPRQRVDPRASLLQYTKPISVNGWIVALATLRKGSGDKIDYQREDPMMKKRLMHQRL
jgi:hypothetical protein